MGRPGRMTSSCRLWEDRQTETQRHKKNLAAKFFFKSSDAPWCRESVGVGRVVANSLPVLVEECHGLLEEHGRGRTFGHRPLQDIEAVFVHKERGKCTRPIGVGKMQFGSFNPVR